MADWASESGHFYDAVTGEPRYTIIGKNGKERPTTRKDAAEHNWYPGATTIIGQVEGWNLREYRSRQMFMAALTLTRADGESDEAFYKRAKADADEHRKKAAQRGSDIHAAVERHYREEWMPEECPSCKCEYGDKPMQTECPDKWHLWPWVETIVGIVNQEFPNELWRPEKSFSHPLGYGGKVDLHSDSILVDFKGRDGADKFKVYDQQAQQLAAYAVGLRVQVAGWPRAGIVFFDRTTPYSEFHEVKPAALERGWRQFEALLNYWKVTNL